MAAGILAVGKSHGGAIEDCMTMLERCVGLNQDPEGAGAEVAAEYRALGLRVPGFGHRQHAADPRSKRLFELASEVGLSGRYVAQAVAMERLLSQTASKSVPLNADGAIAALLCEIAFPKSAANGIFMLARVPGLIAHSLEEQARNRPLRAIDANAYEYDGPAFRTLEISKNATERGQRPSALKGRNS